MRDFRGMKRQRGRNRKPGGGGGGGQNNNPNRSFDSQGPEGIKVRGNAQTCYERYQQLARDAFAAGDRVLAESYLQHAEHYFRVLRVLQPQRSWAEIAQREALNQGFDIDLEDESGQPVEFVEQPQGDGEGGDQGGEGQGGDETRREFRQNRDGRDRWENRDGRDGRDRDNRDRDNRDRGENRNRDFDRDRGDRPAGGFDNRDRPDRDRQGGYRDDRPRDDRPREDRPRDDRPRGEGERRDFDRPHRDVREQRPEGEARPEGDRRPEGDGRDGGRRETRRERFERRRAERDGGPRRDYADQDQPTVEAWTGGEAEASPRGPDPVEPRAPRAPVAAAAEAESHLPAFLSRSAAAVADALAAAPDGPSDDEAAPTEDKPRRTRRRVAPKVVGED